jgi:predicted dehydrogenase
MNKNLQPQATSRRHLLRTATQVAATATLTAAVMPQVHAASDDTIQVALVGCGGRGSGAAINALSTSKQGPIKLVAMADAYEHRLKPSYNSLKRQRGEQVDVPVERQFIGFDAYKLAMDCLKPGDVAIFATPLAFRWVHFQYAISKGINVFMEKPLTADGPTSKRMLDLGKQSVAKNLKVGVGLMSRHAKPLQELYKRIRDGEIGDIITMRGYRMHGLVGSFASPPKPKDKTELDYQVQRFHSLLWAGGGCFSDFYIHIIDHLCWMKDAWPVKAIGVGGRHYQRAGNIPFVDQNFDSYGIEYTFADGAKMFFDGRTMTGAQSIYASYVHGSKGLAIASNSGDCGAPSSIYTGQTAVKDKRTWVSTDNSNPYQNEWEALIDAIRNDKPHNEVKRGVEGSLVTSMGRMAAHTGQEITFDALLNSDHEFAPGIDKLTKDSPAPVMPDSNGQYPQPQPGLKKREY